MHQLDIFTNSPRSPRFDGSDLERHRENNPESQKLHDDNITHFARQDARVLELLRKGEKLTTVEALKIGVGDLRRRIKTLRDAGIAISDEYPVRDGKRSRFKRYFLNQNP